MGRAARAKTMEAPLPTTQTSFVSVTAPTWSLEESSTYTFPDPIPPGHGSKTPPRRRQLPASDGQAPSWKNAFPLPLITRSPLPVKETPHRTLPCVLWIVRPAVPTSNVAPVKVTSPWMTSVSPGWGFCAGVQLAAAVKSPSVVAPPFHVSVSACAPTSPPSVAIPSTINHSSRPILFMSMRFS